MSKSPSSPSGFNDRDADVIIRSSDNIDFRTYKLLLSLASPTFKGMFVTSQIPTTVVKEMNSGNIPTFSLQESSIVIRSILMFYHPECSSDLDDPINFEHLPPVVEAATKYKMDTLIKSVIKSVDGLIETRPLLAYIAYCRMKTFKGLSMQPQLMIAAKRFLAFPMLYFDEPSIDSISSSQYHALLVYHKKCGIATKAAAITGPYSWIPTDMRGTTYFGTIYYQRASSPCRCTVLANGGYDGLPAKPWWWAYMQQCAAALEIRPSATVVLDEDILKQASAKAQDCYTCRDSAYGNLKLFSKPFKAELDRVIGLVSLG